MNLQNYNLDQLINNQIINDSFFLLVDGAQIDRTGIHNISYTYGDGIYLFKGTYEEEAHEYGPILFDLSKLKQDQISNHIKLMKAKDSMILIRSFLDTKQLKNKLLEKLYLEFEDGGIGILRYYDPRVINRFSLIFTNEQKKQLMDGLESISYLLNHFIYEITSDA